MDKYELQKLRDLPIEGVAERLGLRVERHKSLCPFHDDSHPSMSYRVSKNTCRCFVCMTQSIGPIDVVMRHLHLDFKAACRWLADEHNIILDEWQPKCTIGSVPLCTFDASRYARFFEHPFLNDEARRFLFDERRLDPRVVRWCRLTSWRDRQGVPWLQIPYYDREGHLVGLQNRRLQTSPNPSEGGECLPDSDARRPSPPSGELVGVDARRPSPLSGELVGVDARRPTSPSGRPGGVALPRFRFPQGAECGIYNLPVLQRLKQGDALYITEGCSDCWAMLSAGHKAIAIPSATLLRRRDAELLSELAASLSLTFHMYPDRDTPGERLFLQLKQLLPGLQHHQLPPGCKDFSDYYLAGKPP